jgi:hypothetical protein
VHIYVHGMNIWRPKFDAKRTQKYPKSALCTRIRARNAVLGTPFWPKTQPKMRQECIPYTYTCTECSFGDAILIKTQPKICQNCSSCTYTCTEWTFEATEMKKKRRQIMKKCSSWMYTYSKWTFGITQVKEKWLENIKTSILCMYTCTHSFFGAVEQENTSSKTVTEVHSVHVYMHETQIWSRQNA